MTTGPESPVRDAALDAAWREHSVEEPPAHLDGAILAAAHRAVAAGPREIRRVPRPHRWRMPLAAAAMIGALVIGVSRLVPPDQAPIAPERVAEAPAAGRRAPTSPPPPPAPSVAFAPSPAERGPSTALGAVVRSEDAASGSERMRAAGSNAPDATAPDADAWVARIRELYAEGKRTEAAKELGALRATVPDADRRLPPELRAWATTVEP